MSPKAFFLNLGIIATLYASSISFLTFIFSLINKLFPDELINRGYYYADGYSEAMRYSISVLIVVFPLFIFLSRLYRKFSNENPEFRESKLRKWLLYLTLFIAGATIATDVIVLINTFLGGRDLAAPFLLKVLAVLVVSAAIFYFYLKEIKGHWDTHQKQAKLAATITSVVMVVSVVGGFFLIGSPASQRKLAFDQTRVQDLSNIQWQIVNYYQSKGVVPEKLEDVLDPISNQIIPTDPETKIPYEYSKKGNLSFELCATFSLPSSSETPSVASPIPKDTFGENFAHSAGRQCFTRTIDPDRYPLINKTKI